MRLHGVVDDRVELIAKRLPLAAASQQFDAFLPLGSVQLLNARQVIIELGDLLFVDKLRFARSRMGFKLALGIEFARQKVAMAAGGTMCQSASASGTASLFAR